MASWFFIVEWTARLIMLGLVGLSIWSISIILEKRKFLKDLENADNESQLREWIRKQHRSQLLTWSETQKGLRSLTIHTGLSHTHSNAMERSILSELNHQKKDLEKGLLVLGTLGSVTPFIGLLGTILGIIVAFGALSTGAMDSQKVMYALAEALITTAIGLSVAIPAVVAFNFFTRKLNGLIAECASLKDLLIAHFAEENSGKVS